MASHHVSPLASDHVLLPTKLSLIERTLRKGLPLKWGIGLGFRVLLLGGGGFETTSHTQDDACTMFYDVAMDSFCHKMVMGRKKGAIRVAQPMTEHSPLTKHF